MTSKLADSLFTTTQKKVLGLLYLHPEQSFFLNEILRKTGMGVATIKRELDRMLSTDIVQLKKIGNQHHYQANKNNAIYKELSSIVLKTFGMSDVIKSALEPVLNKMNWVFVFGSMVNGKDTANSDIDLMVIGDVGFSEIVRIMHPIEKALAREINPKVYSAQEWNALLEENGEFVKEVMLKPKINIIGSEYGFG